ncbi:MAG: hypothetical protein WAL61_16110 [Acidimicrobiales bacterium]
MKIELTDEQVENLGELLRGALGDLSSEIAATDNPAYRDGLRARRVALEGVLTQLGSGVGVQGA